MKLFNFFFLFNLILFYYSVKCDNIAKINSDITYQLIDGFGGSSAWLGNIPDKGIGNIFGKLGLSILRVGIVDLCKNQKWGNYRCVGQEALTAQKASKYGVKIFASPSTSPISFKTNNNEVMGELREDKYNDYVEYLQSAVNELNKVGVNLYAISLQSEPDFSPPYCSIKWSPKQIAAFLKSYSRKIKGPKIMAPECAHFVPEYNDAILNNPDVAKGVDIIAWHMYGMQLVSQTKAQKMGKSAWMTEKTNDGNDWKSFMETAKDIHDCMTIANYNAYVYFWFKDPKYVSIVDNNYEITSRGYILGQYAKYIRPGYFRINATENPTKNIYVSAYKGNGKVIIVAINIGWPDKNQQFSIKGIKSFTPIITAPNKNMINGTKILVNNGSFNYLLPAMSVVTFVSVN